MAEVIGNFCLRNERVVRQEDDGDFSCTATDRKGTQYTHRFRAEWVEAARHVLSGREIDAQTAAISLSELAQRQQWPYTYGHKLQFYVQDLLLILVALDRADVAHIGRKFLYTVY